MPCEDIPSRPRWAWDATRGEAPPLVAVAAAIMAGLVALLFGQPPVTAGLSAALVGSGTFASLYFWHWLRAPAEIQAERQARLTRWRNAVSGDIRANPNTNQLDLGLFAATGTELQGCWCMVEVVGVSRAEARNGRTGIGFGPNSGPTALMSWDYPASFGPSAALIPGHYKVEIHQGEHVELLHVAEFDLSPQGVIQNQRVLL